MVSKVRAKTPGRTRVVIADSASLLFSDDYRDGWKWGFETIGCEVIIVDVSAAARVPVSTNSPFRVPASGRIFKPLASTIVELDPDIVFFHHGRYCGRDEFLTPLRRAGIPTAVYLCDEPYECGDTLRFAKLYDYVFTMDPGTLAAHKTMKGRADRVFYLPPGVNTDRFKFVPYHQRQVTNRCLFLGNATLTPRPEYLRPVEKAVSGCLIHTWDGAVNKRRKPGAWVSIDKHAELYSSCIVGLNVHRDPCIDQMQYKALVVGKGNTYPATPTLKVMSGPPKAWGTGMFNVYDLPARHVNPRFFEMAACGTLVVSDDHRTEMRRMFPHAPMAESPSKFLDTVLHYLEDLVEAENVGRWASELISRRHTYRHRAAEVLHRAGLKEYTTDKLSLFSVEPKEWLTTQDFDASGVHRFSEPTGPSGSGSLLTGKYSTLTSGSPNPAGSLDLVPIWRF